MSTSTVVLISFAAFLLGFIITRIFFISRREHQRICDELRASHQRENEALQQMHSEMVTASQRMARETMNAAEAKFGEISEKILKAKAAELEDGNSKNVFNVMKPYESRLEEFRKQIISLNESNNNFRGSLSTFSAVSEKLRSQTENLTRALSSGQKNQGLFGEQQLEKILAASGLAEHAEYRLQCALPGENGDGRLIPDAVIQLPDSDALLIVDSKASFTAFMEHISAAGENAAEDALKKHITSLRKHIQELKGKHYAEEYRKRTGKDAVDTVFMFVPSDHALQAALEKCPELWQEAVTNGVLLVSPSTLMVAVHIVDIGWRRVKFNRNTDAILNQAQHILDNIREFLACFDEVGSSLDDARKNWEKSRKKLLASSTGKSNTISDNAVQLIKLGLKANTTAKNKAADKYLYAAEAEAGEPQTGTLQNP